MIAAALCSAILALLVFALGFNTSVQRVRTNIITGVSGDPVSSLDKAVRAHGNTIEYVPVLIAMMLYLGTTDPALWEVALMVFVTISRLMMALGFLVCPTLAKPHPLKVLGSLGTYTFGILLSVAVALSAFA